MGVNCLIFTGDSVTPCVSKYAGAYRIATELRNNGFTVQVVDLGNEQTYSPLIKFVIKKFVDENTLWIGFSTNFFDNILGHRVTRTPLEKQKYFEESPDCDIEIRNLVNHAKSINPNLKFVVGGIKIFNFDHLGFYTFKGHTDREIVDFTIKCRDNIAIPSKLIQNKEFTNFTKSSTHYTKQDVFNDEKSLPIEISRGCIFRCKFCDFPLNGKTKHDYIRDYGLIREEIIRNYEQFNITHYNFAEDTYNDSVVKLEGLLENVFRKLPFKITFAAYIRLDLLMRFPETEDILVESGLKSALFGIETLNPTNAKIIGKGIDPMLQLEKVARLKQDKFKDINCASGFILGLPDDSIESIEKQCEWSLTDNNPLDDWYFEVLGIKPKGYESYLPYKSEFELNYQKYGYSFTYNSAGRLIWHNENHNISYDDLLEIKNDIVKKSRKSLKNKYGGFTYSIALDLGYDPSLITTKSRFELDQLYNKEQILKDKKINYYRKLMQIDKK